MKAPRKSKLLTAQRSPAQADQSCRGSRGLGFRLGGLGFRVGGLGFRFGGLGLRVGGSGYGVYRG